MSYLGRSGGPSILSPATHEIAFPLRDRGKTHRNPSALRSEGEKLCEAGSTESEQITTVSVSSSVLLIIDSKTSFQNASRTFKRCVAGIVSVAVHAGWRSCFYGCLFCPAPMLMMSVQRRTIGSECQTTGDAESPRTKGTEFRSPAEPSRKMFMAQSQQRKTKQTSRSKVFGKQGAVEQNNRAIRD